MERNSENKKRRGISSLKNNYIIKDILLQEKMRDRYRIIGQVIDGGGSKRHKDISGEQRKGKCRRRVNCGKNDTGIRCGGGT